MNVHYPNGAAPLPWKMNPSSDGIRGAQGLEVFKCKVLNVPTFFIFAKTWAYFT